jgi:pterin-4a-carbinolamine dehydratase
VSVRLNTHDAGARVTAKDVALAQRFERLMAG